MAVIAELLANLEVALPSILVALLVLHFTRNYFQSGVTEVPGPFLAKISNLWRFLDVACGQAHATHLQLHKQYGPYVRLGPNLVSVQNLDALKTIYGINKGYYKTGFYAVQQQLANGKPTQTLFTTLDEDFHARIKRPVSSAYSMSTLTEFEVFVDKTIRTMVGRLEEFAERKESIDMAVWLQYYAFDVIGELTFSKPLGFLEKGQDIDNIMHSIEKTLDYAGMVGQMPWLDYLLVKNPLRHVMSSGSTTAIAQFARQCMNERLNKDSKRHIEPGRRDFLTRFLDAKKTHPDIVNDRQVFSYTLSNVNAGSDTTAISLRSVLYFLLKNPAVLDRVVAELHEARTAGRLSLPVTWKQSQELPYLDAVIKEALRLHPAVGLLLERIVPRGGLQLPDGGPHLPAGTVVGINPWVMHHHPLFGSEPDQFVPERWLKASDESAAAYQTRRADMLGATFTFGAGARTCIGKNISLLEIYKAIPTLLYTFKFELTDPNREWETCNAWFVRQKHIDVRLTRLHDLDPCA